MPKITMEIYEERPTLPTDSILLLKVTEIRVREIQGGRNGSFEKLEFKFKVLDIQAVGDDSPKEYYESLIGEAMYGNVPFRLNNGPENKLKNWVEAILGMDLDVGFELDTDLLEGKQVRGISTQYDKRTTDPRTGQPFKGMSIDALLPVGTGANAHRWSSAAPASAAADPWVIPAPAAVPAGTWGVDEAPF